MFNSYNLIHYRIGFLTSDTFFPYQSKLSKKEEKNYEGSDVGHLHSTLEKNIWRWCISFRISRAKIFVSTRACNFSFWYIFRFLLFKSFFPFWSTFSLTPHPLPTFFLSSAKKAVDNKLKYRTKGLNGGSKKLEMGLYREELKSELGASGSPSSSLYLPPPPLKYAPPPLSFFGIFLS